MKVNVPDELLMPAVELQQLSEVWRDHITETRSVGDEWLAKRTSALLVVPSVPSPESHNCLLNPLHADARKIQVEWCRWIKYDQRLFRVGVTV